MPLMANLPLKKLFLAPAVSASRVCYAFGLNTPLHNQIFVAASLHLPLLPCDKIEEEGGHGSFFFAFGSGDYSQQNLEGSSVCLRSSTP